MPRPWQLSSFSLLILTLVLLITQTSASQCASQCQYCFNTPSLFTCQKCKSNISVSQYIWNCQYINRNSPLFIGLCIPLVVLHMIMLGLGFGVYQTIYEQIQLVSILLWVQVGNSEVIALQGTNFGIENNNSFVRTYGVQYIVILFILSAFLFLVAGVTRVVHNPTAVLILRKRAIFPVRIVTICYNILLFSSLVSVVMMRNLAQIDILQLFLSILGLVTATSIFLGIFFLCNFKKFKLDDPNYYVVCEKMVSIRWWVKNKLFIQMVNNTIIIMAFVLGFTKPSITIIPILVSQSLFTLYIFLFIGYTKIRYKLFITLSNFIFLGILVTLNGLTTSTQTTFNSYKVAYYIFVIALCCTLLAGELVEIFAQKYKFGRQIRSFKNRFILCEKLESQVEMSKYDEHGKRQKVIEFQDNQVYGQDLSIIRQKLNKDLQNTIY